jgi:hypothetical protein
VLTTAVVNALKKGVSISLSSSATSPPHHHHHHGWCEFSLVITAI